MQFLTGGIMQCLCHLCSPPRWLCEKEDFSGHANHPCDGPIIDMRYHHQVIPLVEPYLKPTYLMARAILQGRHKSMGNPVCQISWLSTWRLAHLQRVKDLHDGYLSYLSLLTLVRGISKLSGIEWSQHHKFVCAQKGKRLAENLK